MVLWTMAHLGPFGSAEHSLRFRDSALAGSDEFSPTPLIVNAYQLLDKQKAQVLHVKTKLLASKGRAKNLGD